MKMTIDEFMFCDEFEKRDQTRDKFSYEGKKALYEFCMELEDDTGIECELDTVCLCCDYDEYDSIEEILEAYSGIGLKSIDELIEKTDVIKFERYVDLQKGKKRLVKNCYIVRNF